MGTTKGSVYDDIVKNNFLFCVKNKIWITAAHIPGDEDVTADYKSRKSYKDPEQMLNLQDISKGYKASKN